MLQNLAIFGALLSFVAMNKSAATAKKELKKLKQLKKTN
jgi:hypothetical protein